MEQGVGPFPSAAAAANLMARVLANGYVTHRMKVHEIMTAHARCVRPDNTLVEVAGYMAELDVGALPVCDADRLAGMITDRDIAVRAVAKGCDPSETAVSEIMTPSIVYIFADQSVEEATRVMQEHEIRRLPVLNRQKRLVGIVSLGDIAMSSHPAFSGQTLRQISKPTHTDGRARKRDAIGRAAGAADVSWPGEAYRTGALSNLRNGTGTTGEAKPARSRTKAEAGATRKSPRRATTQSPTRTKAGRAKKKPARSRARA